LRVAGGMIFAFGINWAAYFTFLQTSASLHPDMTEAYFSGREFRLGYNQRPPFWVWIRDAWFGVWPRTGWGSRLAEWPRLSTSGAPGIDRPPV